MFITGRYNSATESAVRLTADFNVKTGKAKFFITAKDAKGHISRIETDDFKHAASLYRDILQDMEATA